MLGPTVEEQEAPFLEDGGVVRLERRPIDIAERAQALDLFFCQRQARSLDLLAEFLRLKAARGQAEDCAGENHGEPVPRRADRVALH